MAEALLRLFMPGCEVHSKASRWILRIEGPAESQDWIVMAGIFDFTKRCAMIALALNPLTSQY
jgi:hypothetical protein